MANQLVYIHQKRKLPTNTGRRTGLVVGGSVQAFKAIGSRVLTC